MELQHRLTLYEVPPVQHYFLFPFYQRVKGEAVGRSGFLVDILKISPHCPD